MSEAVLQSWNVKLYQPFGLQILQQQVRFSNNAPVLTLDQTILTAAQGLNQVYSLTITATGGTYTLSLGGQTSTAIASGADADAIQAALGAISTVGVGNVKVDAHTSSYWITFINNLGAGPVPALTIGVGSLTGGTGTVTALQTGTPLGSAVTTPPADATDIATTVPPTLRKFVNAPTVAKPQGAYQSILSGVTPSQPVSAATGEERTRYLWNGTAADSKVIAGWANRVSGSIVTLNPAVR